MFRAVAALGGVMVFSLVADRHKRDMVNIRTVCPDIRIELRYGASRNGVGRAVYAKGSRCLLRRGTAERLCRVQQRLTAQRLGLKVWDAYRPLSAQRALWEICPNQRFVAPPRRGSKHNRGAAVDVTLVDAGGRELPMPSDFDNFTARAKSDYSGGTAEQRKNRDTLHAAMAAEGFVPYRSEWWHFHDPDWRSYRLLDLSLLLSGHKSRRE